MLNSGAPVHARLPVALDKILRDRGLTAPSGGPLYAYRFTAGEIAALKEPLTQALAFAGSTCLDTNWCSRAFVAIACHWFRSWRGEGAWGYAPLCAELGLHYRQDDWHNVTSGIREGLRGWGRRVRRNERGGDEFLASLICEGGLPLRAIHGGRWLYQWLQGALDLVARGVDPGQAAAQEAWRVPSTFRTHLIPVAAELIEQVDQIKRDLAASADRAGLDAVAWLDLNRKGWRKSLPLDMGDEDARTLIEHVVRRAERSALGDIGLQRGLVQGASGLCSHNYRFPSDEIYNCSYSPDNYIDHNIELNRSTAPSRVRFSLATDLLDTVEYAQQPLEFLQLVLQSPVFDDAPSAYSCRHSNTWFGDPVLSRDHRQQHPPST